MGRGLSKLQEFILCEANRLGRCYYADVLEKYFQWIPIRPIERFGETTTDIISGQPQQTVTPKELIGRIKYPGLKYFSPGLIGKKEYQKVMASLSRSCERLRERGLVNCLQGADQHWAAVELTEKGRYEAQTISNREIILGMGAEGKYIVKVTRRRIVVKAIGQVKVKSG